MVQVGAAAAAGRSQQLAGRRRWAEDGQQLAVSQQPAASSVQAVTGGHTTADLSDNSQNEQGWRRQNNRDNLQLEKNRVQCEQWRWRRDLGE